MSVWIRLCQRCAKILSEANMNNHFEPEMEGLKVLLLSAGSLSCQVFVNAEEGVGQSAGSKLAITVACIRYNVMNHYHCSMKDHNLAGTQPSPCRG